METVTERISTEADGPTTVNERLSPGGPGPEGQPDTAHEQLSGQNNGHTEALAGPPAESALKAEWVDYAVACGADRSEAEDQTKAELVEQYG